MATVDLNTRFVPTLAGNTAALAASDDGTILYGIKVNTLRGFRFDATGSTSEPIPFVAPTDARNPVAEKGSSASGRVAVGTSIDADGRRAYRYEHSGVGAGVTTAIPLLTGGTVNDGLAVSTNGDLVLVAGNSPENPNGEAYLYDFSKPAVEAITRLGSPNAEMRQSFCANDNVCGQALRGGMTDDGSVVVMGWYGAAGRHSYFHNARLVPRGERASWRRR